MQQSSCSSSARPMVKTPVIVVVSVSLDSVFMRRAYAAVTAHGHSQCAVCRSGTMGTFANSPASARRRNSASALSVRYCLPAMLMVASHPLLRQRHAVTREMPACSQNLCRLRMGLPSIVKLDVVFTPGEYAGTIMVEGRSSAAPNLDKLRAAEYPQTRRLEVPQPMTIFSDAPSERDKPVSSSADAVKIAAHIQRLLPNVHSGTLQFWGVWFGRPHDNCHSVVAAEAEGDCLTVHFNEEETLKVWHPVGWRIDAEEFVIRSAGRVMWQWFWYGRPHVPGNLMTYEFTRHGAEVSFQTTFPLGHPGTPSILEPAVQLH